MVQSYDCQSPAPFPFREENSAAGTWKMRRSSSWRKKDYPLPDVILVTEQTKAKPQRHQSHNLTQTPNSLWMWEEVAQIDIPLFSPHGSSTPTTTTTNHKEFVLPCMCKICVGCKIFLWLIRPIGGISVSTLCHRLVYQYDGSLPWFLRRSQPKAHLIHSPTNVFN